MRVVSRNLALLVAAAALAAATSTVATPAPASAATCSTGQGVSVVVDFHELGGGVRTACVADGGGQLASSLVPSAGFPLTYAQRQPGFVCRVSGQPASDPCVNTSPADAYWGLWWSDGKTGSWSYATSGAGSLRVPDGGYVAFSWNGSPTRSAPGVAPAVHRAATPTPTASASSSAAPSSPHPSSQHSSPAAATDPSSSASGSATPDPTDPTDMETATPSKRHHHTPSTAPSPDAPTATDSANPDQVAPASADAAESDDGGLPAWVAPAVIVVLFGAVGAVLVVRRRRAVP